MKKNRRNLFDYRRFLIPFCLVLSILVWVIIAGFVTPGEEENSWAISIDYTRNESTYRNQNLVITSDLTTTTKVTISGNDTVVFGIGPSDVSVYLDYSNVNGPGTYDLPLITDNVSANNFNIIKTSPQLVRVTFEAVERKTLTISARADNVEAAPGYYKDTLLLSTSTVDISGPASQVRRVAQAVVVVQSQEVRESNIVYVEQVRLLDETGAELDRSQFTLSVSEVEVTVPILEEQELALTVELSGYPAGFDVEWFESLMHFSVDSIKVAAPSAELDKITDISLGVIDVSTYEPGVQYELPIILPQGFNNRSGIRIVTVTFDVDVLAVQEYTIPAENIRLINVPLGVDVEPEENNVVVTLAGPPDALASLLPENIIVQVDAYNVSVVQGGQQAITARVLVASNNQVFAVGSYNVVCHVTPASGTGEG